MTAHISERVLLLASDERDILRRKRPEQDLVAGATYALSASSPPARCSLYLEASSGAGRLRQLQGGRASPRTSRCAGPGACPLRRRPAGCGRLTRPPGNPVLLAAPAGLARCRRRSVPGIWPPVAQLPHPVTRRLQDPPAAADASGTPAAGEQAHMITNRPRPVIATGTSSLQKGDQLPCPQ